MKGRASGGGVAGSGRGWMDGRARGSKAKPSDERCGRQCGRGTRERGGCDDEESGAGEWCYTKRESWSGCPDLINAECSRVKKLTAPQGLPRQSPTLVLARP